MNPEPKAAFDGARLAKVTNFVKEYIEAGHVVGAGLAVQRDGRLEYLCTEGLASTASGVAFSDQTMYRCASLTKGVTSVAFMTLVEEGHCHLQEPVAKYIPEFANMKVLALQDGTIVETECTAPMKLINLLNHTSGLSYPLARMFVPNDPIVNHLTRLYEEQALFNLPCNETHTSQYLLERLARLPLAFQPGTRFLYSLATDILGIIIERITGMSFDAYCQARIFGPLQMSNTYFTLPDSEDAGLAELYEPDEMNAPPLIPVTQETRTRGSLMYHPSCYFKNPNVHKSGGGGLISTIADFNKFLNSCLASHLGEDFAPKIVSRHTMQLMASNALHQRDGVISGPGYTFGLGFSILMEPGLTGSLQSPGTFGWGGVFGTVYFIDPVERMTCLCVTQRFPNTAFDLRAKFANLVYQALN